MTTDLISKYVWIVDTITRYGTLTRRQLNDLWVRTSISDGHPIPERTFYNYRRAIESLFNIDIQCDSAGGYSIKESDSRQDEDLRNWLMDAYAVRGAVGESKDITRRMVIDTVPSAREFLPDITEAMRNNQKVEFTYSGFSRSMPEMGIVFRPYFVRFYRQRWYMVGYQEKVRELRTYALDRIATLKLLTSSFSLPENSDARTFYDDYIGVTTSQSDTYTVEIQTSPRQAKYFRALPFHHSQQESVHEKYSIFSYRLKLNYELVHELLFFGPAVKILSPPELRLMVTEELRKTMTLYESDTEDIFSDR